MNARNCPRKPLDDKLAPKLLKKGPDTPNRRGLELEKRGEAEAAALDRVEVNIIHAVCGLARQARPVGISDVVGLVVEDIEYVEAQPQLPVHLVRCLRIEQSGRLGLDAIVLEQ